MCFGLSVTPPFTTVGNQELFVFFIISLLAQRQANSPDNLAVILLNISFGATLTLENMWK